jgi:hypothetical protein
MKNKFLQISMLALSAASLMFASCSKESTSTPANNVPTETFLASTTMGTRTALLEDFTGVRCGYCPDGHVRAEAAQKALGKDKFIIMCVHAGGYAAATAGWANFTTAFGTALVNQSSVAGYPAGTINRLPAPDMGVTAQSTTVLTGLALNRGDWDPAGRFVNTMFAPANIGTSATFDAASRELTVKVDVYYVANETKPNSINVALTQSNLMAKQSGDPTPNDLYSENHVLRHLITGQWGNPIADSLKVEGSKVSRTFKYIVPADYNGITADGGGAVKIENCSVVAFITRDKVDVINAAETSITVK